MAMKAKKKSGLALAALAGLLLLGSASRTSGVSARLVDSDGHPLAGAYVLSFRLTPALLNQWRGHTPYRTEPGLTRTDAAGRFEVPGRIRFHFPFLQFLHPPLLRLALYVPGLHNFCRIEDAAAWTVDPPCASGQMQTVARSPELTLRFADLSDRPEHWYYSLFQLVYTLLFDPSNPSPEKRELAAALRNDFEQFAGKYGGAVREIRSDDFVWITPEDQAQFQGQQQPWAFYLRREWLGKTLGERILELENELK